VQASLISAAEWGSLPRAAASIGYDLGSVNASSGAQDLVEERLEEALCNRGQFDGNTDGARISPGPVSQPCWTNPQNLEFLQDAKYIPSSRPRNYTRPRTLTSQSGHL